MNVTTERLEDNKVALDITVPQEDVAKAFDRAWKNIAAKVAIPGFRKGKAPRKIIEQRIGLPAIKEEAFELLAGKYYAEALERENLEPVSQPSVDIGLLEEDKDMQYKVTVTVKPEVELGQYKDIKVEKTVRPVTEEDITESIDRLRERKAEMVVAEGAKLGQGDFAIIDFAGFIDGQPFSGGEGKGYPLEIGSGNFIPGFEEQLLGAAAGEERTVNVSFPEDYFAKELAGKAAEFKVTVHDVKRKQLPELTDEFVKENSKFATVEEWKDDCKKRMEEAAERSAQTEYENGVIKAAVDNAKVEVPSVMVENRISEIIEDTAANLKSRGLNFEDYLQYTGKTILEMRDSHRDNAKEDVKAELAMDAIVKAEDLKVEPAELEKELEMMAAQYKRPVAEVQKALITSGNITAVNRAILRRKAARMILDTAAKEQ